MIGQEKELLQDIPSSARFWVDVLTLIGGFVGLFSGAAWWVIRQSLVTHKDMAETIGPLGEDMDAQGARISVLETDMKHMPSSSEISDLRERMTRLEGTAQAIRVEVQGVHELLERIERPLNVLVDGALKAGALKAGRA